MENDLVQMTYATDIDYERLFNMSKDDVAKYAYDKFNTGRLTEKQFFAVSRAVLRVCDIVGLSPDNEQMLFVLADVNRLLCESCAGSGKTTMSQMCALKYKMAYRVPGDNILCLAYNKNAVEDMESRHIGLVYTINKILRASYEEQIRRGTTTKLWKDIMVSSSIRCSTIHAWAREWVVTFADKLKLDLQNFMLSEDETLNYLERLTIQYTKDRNVFVSRDVCNELLRIYGYAKETLTLDKPERWGPVLQSDIGGLSLMDISRILTGYEAVKKRRHRYDFEDLLYVFYDLLKEAEILKRVRDNYKLLLVDEYQDATPAMLRIIKLFAEGDVSLGLPRYDELRLICVGDTDQAIYGYRGTDPFNCIRFKSDYQGEGQMDSRIVSMSVNRRCAKEILDAARRVILSNPERIEKPILGLRDGGCVKLYKYGSDDSQASTIIRILRDIPQSEWGDTCICYRNNLSSRYISIRLFEQQMPFRNMKEDQALFEDKVSQLAKAILLLFRFPASKSHMLQVLYKLLPQNRSLNKAALEDIIEQATDETRFWELDFKQYRDTIKGLDNCMKCIHRSYKIYRSGAVLAEYMPPLFRLFRAKDYIYFRNASEQELLFADYMQSWYSQPVTISTLQKRTNDTFDHYEEAMRAGRCVNLSTFHGLKGLEFKHVIIIDLSDALFPGNELSKNKHMDAKQLALIERESRRLLYVAVTRAKDTAHLLFSESNPTRYIQYFENNAESQRFRRVLEDPASKSIGEFVLDDTDTTTLDSVDESYHSKLEEDEDLLVEKEPEYMHYFYEPPDKNHDSVDALVRQIFKRTGGTINE